MWPLINRPRSLCLVSPGAAVRTSDQGAGSRTADRRQSAGEMQARLWDRKHDQYQVRAFVVVHMCLFCPEFSSVHSTCACQLRSCRWPVSQPVTLEPRSFICVQKSSLSSNQASETLLFCLTRPTQRERGICNCVPLGTGLRCFCNLTPTRVDRAKNEHTVYWQI